MAEAHPGKNDQLKRWGEDAAMSLTLKQRQGWRRMHCCRAGGFDISEGLVMDQSSLDLDCWHGTGSSCSWVDLLSGSKSKQSQSSTISTCDPLLANSSVRWMSHDWVEVNSVPQSLVWDILPQTKPTRVGKILRSYQRSLEFFNNSWSFSKIGLSFWKLTRVFENIRVLSEDGSLPWQL